MRNTHLTITLAALVSACSATATAPSQGEAQPQGAQAVSARTPAPLEKPTPESEVQAPVATLTRIEDPSTVCMVNNQYMGAPQIPVAVEGKTYYGCCQMCEARLQQDASARLGVDPVSRRQVDKALAVMARDTRGRIVYFENEENLRSYVAAR